VRRLPWELLALPALGIARLLPADGAGLYVRLASATVCLLLPGALLARLFGRRSTAGALSWSLVVLFAASAITFAADASLALTLVLAAAVGAAAVPFALARPLQPPSRAGILVLAAGVGFGIALWPLLGRVAGDAFFHLARVRKLDAFDDLSLDSLNEFADGGLHPGYAFPLWHVFLALVARLADVDPGAVVARESSVLVPLAFLVAFEAGRAVFRSSWGGVSVLLAQAALIGLAPGHGGAYRSLALPATASRQLLVPAAVALFFWFLDRPSRGGALSVGAAGLALAVVHPTYLIFVAIPLAGFVVARALLARAEVRAGLAALAALLVPAGAFFVWLLPVVSDTRSVDPDRVERLRGLEQYAGQLDVSSLDSFRLSPEVFGRAGAVAVAALVLVPVAALAGRRRWAAFVLGGSLAVLVIALVPWLFTAFSDGVSLSQSRRAAGFVPFAFALAGGALVLARYLGLLVLPIGLAAGIALQLAYPGDFGYVLEDGGPALATWIAAVGGGAALAAAVVIRRTGAEGRDWLAAAACALFVLPVAVHGFSQWDRRSPPGQELTAGLVSALQAFVPERAVVYSDDATSYRIAAAVPVYIANAPPGHVADTVENRPYERRADARRFFRTRDLAIPRRYGAGWLVVDRKRFGLPFRRTPVYRDPRYALYRL
jgi:hypothetical protein